MIHHPYTGLVYLAIVGVICVAALIIGAVLAANDYSSAGAFSVASACVGVLATLAGQHVANTYNHQQAEEEQ